MSIKDFFTLNLLVLIPILSLMTGLYELEKADLNNTIKEIYEKSDANNDKWVQSYDRDLVRIREEIRRVYEGTH